MLTNSFCIRSTCMSHWNRLPNEVRQRELTDLNEFKTTL